MKNANKILILGSIGLDTIQTKYGKKEEDTLIKDAIIIQDK